MIEHRILSNGKVLRYRQAGIGPALVFLHGYPDNLRIWDGLVEELKEHFQCWAFDWPGMGDSEEWPGGATPQHLGQRLGQIMTELKIEKPILVAMDMGAQAALDFAARNPTALVGLVVMNSLVFGDEKTSWEISVLRKYGWNRWILENLPRLVFWRALRTFLPPGERLDKEIQADLWRSFRKKKVRKYISKMCAGYQGTLDKLPAQYVQITAPTLILWAENDKHFPPVQAERLHRMIPSSRLIIVPRGEHWMPYSRAGEIKEALCSHFLGSASKS